MSDCLACAAESVVQPAVTDDGLCRTHDLMLRSVLSSQALSGVIVSREAGVRILVKVFGEPVITLDVEPR